MSDEILKGAFETAHGNLEKMLRWMVAPLDEERYDQAYLNLSDESLRTIANAGEHIAAFCTFEEPFVEEIQLHDSIDEDAGMEAVVDVVDFRNYLDFVGGDRIAVEFYGIEGERGATRMKLIGDLTADMYIPSSKSDYESKNTAIARLYDSEDQWVKPSSFSFDDETADDGEPLSTAFTTTADQFGKIVEVTEFEDIVLSNYPVAIQNGEFVLDAEDDNARNKLSGSLFAEDVEGPDVDNTYSRGFQQLFNNISGRVDVMIEQDHPISVVRSSNDDAMTLRYCILPTA